MTEVTYKTTAAVHSIVADDDAVVDVRLPNNAAAQGYVKGVTVELIDHNGTCHTHRFLNQDKALTIFGVQVDVEDGDGVATGEKRWVPTTDPIACTYAREVGAVDEDEALTEQPAID